METTENSSLYKIKTDRLLLREFCPEDLEFAYSLFSDKDLMSHYPTLRSLEETKQWLQRTLDRYERDGYSVWIMELIESGKPIGYCGPIKQNIRGFDEVEIGYMLKTQYQGKGLVTEAALACHKYAQEILQARYVVSYIRPANEKSIKVALRTGMHFEVFLPVEKIKWSVDTNIYRKDFFETKEI